MIFVSNLRLFLGCLYHSFKCVLFRNRRIFLQIKPYLITGRFQNSKYCDYIYEISHERHFDNITFSSTANRNRIADWLIDKLKSLVTYNNYTNGNFGGTEIIISSSCQEYKIFNIEKAAVMTIYSNYDKMRRIVTSKKVFDLYFNVAKTINVDFKELQIVEQYIHCIGFDIEKAFCAVASQYVGYAQNIDINKDINIYEACNFFVHRFGISANIDYIKLYPTIYTHGDLWRGNVMYDGSNYYITDFEIAKSRYFLYDLFCCIFSEYLIYDDDTMLNNYLKGSYDEIFNDVCVAVNVNFEADEKEKYLLAYMVAFVYERWYNFADLDYKIIRVLNNLKLIN